MPTAEDVHLTLTLALTLALALTRTLALTLALPPQALAAKELEHAQEEVRDIGEI